ncbi:hypothetical protein CRM22_006262 [Opisthorchis felineus]|uniref:Aspartyl aminopeptidase n=1 Tax=Opisthorchis felineus TaxID=147828 RepID=A0A4S2LNN7_OPIFE|nr:hypothetical protein CRM22_006262 [Opisthorchis felineus]
MDERSSVICQGDEKETLTSGISAEASLVLTEGRTLFDSHTKDLIETAHKMVSPAASKDETKTPQSLTPCTPDRLSSPPSILQATLNSDASVCPPVNMTPPGTSCHSGPASRPVSPACAQLSSSPNLSSSHPVASTAVAASVRRPRHKPGERRELLTRAVQDVLNQHISMRRAAQKYNLAKSSLCDFVRKNKISLPNLRIRARTAGPEPNITQPDTRVVTSGTKRLPPDGDDTSSSSMIPNKLACGLGRKSSGLSLTESAQYGIAAYGNSDNFEITHSQNIGHTGFVDGAHTNNNSVDSWAHEETSEVATTADGIYAQTRPPSYSAVTSVSGRSSAALSFSKPSRLESPWHNSAGLPTQVPMRSWSAHSNSTQAANGSVPGGASTVLERRLQFNSLSQLRQTIEAQNLITEHNIRALAEGADFNQLSAATSLPAKINSIRKSANGCDEAPSHAAGNDLSQTCQRMKSVGALSSSDVDCNPIKNCLRQTEVLNGSHDPMDCCATDLSEHRQAPNMAAVNPSSGSSAADHSENVSNIGERSSTNTPTELGSQNFAASFNIPAGVASQRSEGHPFTRSRDPRLPFSAYETSLIGPATSEAQQPPNNPIAATIAQSIFSSSNSTNTPYPALASILSADFASANQNALAAFLFQQSRSLSSSGSVATPNLPNLIGCPNQLSFPAAVSVNPPTQLLTSDFALSTPAGLLSSSIANPRLSATRLSSGHPSISASVPPFQSGVSNNFPVADLSLQPNLEDLQQFFYRQLQPRLFNDLNASPQTVTALATQLLLPQPNQTQNQPFRNLLTSLLGSLNSKIQTATFSGPNTITSLTQASTSTGPINTATETNASQPNATPQEPLNKQPILSGLIPSSTQDMSSISSHARGLVDFINKSPSPFHAVHSACELLLNTGFRELKEGDTWRLKPTDCVFIKKNGSTLIAAAIGGKFKPGNGFHLLGAHTDSPCLRLKPVSERIKEGYVQLGVETYGGGLWYTWFDRELKVAGRAVTAGAGGRLQEHLIHIDRPVACVPSLAIHLNQDIKTSGFNPNTEQHVVPILCTELMDQVNSNNDLAAPTSSAPSASIFGFCGRRRHSAGLLQLVSEQTGITDNMDTWELELCLADFQPARIGGLHNEFIHAPRLDNLFNSYAGLHGMVDSLSSLADESSIRVVCLFDHEEIGSVSTQGANSQHTMNILRRLANTLAEDKCTLSSGSGENPVAVSTTHFEESLSKSFLLSADQAHALHPSYHDRHEPNHRPLFHRGIVLKCNSNQRYATNSLTAAAVRQVARLADVPVQEFVVRQDMHCGSTIGPLLSSQLGIATADVGFPQLAMHSCRELCCTTSISQAVRFYTAFYEHLSKIWPPA